MQTKSLRPTRTLTPKKPSKLLRILQQNYQLYIFMLPAFAYFLIFVYFPMYGVQIAFKDFVATQGIWGSKWVGLKHFERLVTSNNFTLILKNTLSISLYSMVVGFPLPIILALFLNEAKDGFFKKFVQSVTYAPYFISVVVLVGMIQVFFAQNNGIINILLGKIGVEPTNWLGKKEYFQTLYVLSGLWQGTGWGAIVYLARLSGVEPELIEAATIDGATRFQRMIHINIPAIVPTMTILFILSAGGIMSVGFEKIFLMQNPLVIETSEVISTYVYKTGLQNAQYSFSTAVGLLNSVVNLLLLVIVNFISSKLTETSLW